MPQTCGKSVGRAETMKLWWEARSPVTIANRVAIESCNRVGTAAQKEEDDALIRATVMFFHVPLGVWRSEGYTFE